MIKHTGVFFYFFLIACYITYPLIFHITNFATGTIDELYITWILNWNIHALSTNIFSLFNGNIYYPYHFSLAFSDLHLTSSLLAFLLIKIFHQPLISYNMNFILLFCLLVFCTYLLVYYFSKSIPSSILAGTVFGFSTSFLLKLGHLQLLTIYWIPLSLLAFAHYLKTKKYKYFLLTVLFFYLQFLN